MAYFDDESTNTKMAAALLLLILGASVAEWLRSLTSDHKSLTAVGLILTRVEIFHVRKPSSWLTEGRWFYPDARSSLK
jgi:hypothetical protein